MLATVNFSADSIKSLQGIRGNIDGIDSGFESGDLTFQADFWNGSANNGEFTVSGTFFDVSS